MSKICSGARSAIDANRFETNAIAATTGKKNPVSRGNSCNTSSLGMKVK